jgi:hypothetical protein
MAVFWVVAPYSLIEERHLHTRRSDNTKSHLTWSTFVLILVLISGDSL